MLSQVQLSKRSTGANIPVTSLPRWLAACQVAENCHGHIVYTDTPNQHHFERIQRWKIGANGVVKNPLVAAVRHSKSHVIVLPTKVAGGWQPDRQQLFSWPPYLRCVSCRNNLVTPYGIQIFSGCYTLVKCKTWQYPEEVRITEQVWKMNRNFIRFLCASQGMCAKIVEVFFLISIKIACTFWLIEGVTFFPLFSHSLWAHIAFNDTLQPSTYGTHGVQKKSLWCTAICDSPFSLWLPCVATDNNKEKAGMLTEKWDDHCLPWSSTIITDLTNMVSLIQAEQGRQLSCM